MNINVDEIVYVHCHQAGGQDTGGTIILVGQDGVQRSPIHFPEGGHMAAFLSCLETGIIKSKNFAVSENNSVFENFSYRTFTTWTT